MSRLYGIIGALIISTMGFSQLNEVTIGYQLSLPQSAMKNGCYSGHGLHFGNFRHFKYVKGFSVGADFGIGSYASVSHPQQYVFRDGSITNTEAVLSSSLYYASLAARYVPFSRKNVSTFIEVQGGYFGMYSSIFIADPLDPLGCRALENRNLVGSGTAYWSPGAGLQILLNKNPKREVHTLTLGTRFISGRALEYANMNRIYHNHSNGPVQPSLEPSNGESPLMITFINVATNERHEHSVAELYTHPLRALQFNLSYSYRFGK